MDKALPPPESTSLAPPFTPACVLSKHPLASAAGQAVLGGWTQQIVILRDPTPDAVSQLHDLSVITAVSNKRQKGQGVLRTTRFER